MNIAYSGSQVQKNEICHIARNLYRRDRKHAHASRDLSKHCWATLYGPTTCPFSPIHINLKPNFVFPVRPNQKECRSHLVYSILHIFSRMPYQNECPRQWHAYIQCLMQICKRERVMIKITRREKVIINPIPRNAMNQISKEKESSEHLIQQDYHHRTSYEPREHHPAPFLPCS